MHTDACGRFFTIQQGCDKQLNTRKSNQQSTCGISDEKYLKGCHYSEPEWKAISYLKLRIVRLS